MYSCMQNFKFQIFGNFFKIRNFDFVLFWLGIPLARARPAVPLGLWSIMSSLRWNLYVPRLHKFIKWFADNDVPQRN